jgi:hypothetical protein
MGTIGDAPGAARFLELGTDMELFRKVGASPEAVSLVWCGLAMSMPNPVGCDFEISRVVFSGDVSP